MAIQCSDSEHEKHLLAYFQTFYWANYAEPKLQHMGFEGALLFIASLHFAPIKELISWNFFHFKKCFSPLHNNGQSHENYLLIGQKPTFHHFIEPIIKRVWKIVCCKQFVIFKAFIIIGLTNGTFHDINQLGKKKKVCLKAHTRVCEIGRFGQKLMWEFFLFPFLFFLNENLPVVRWKWIKTSEFLG